MLHIPLAYESLEYIPLVYKALYSTGLQSSYSIFPWFTRLYIPLVYKALIVYSPGLQGSIFHWFTKLLQYIPLVYKALTVYSPGLRVFRVYPLVYKALYSTSLQSSYSKFPWFTRIYIPLVYKALTVNSPGLQGSIFPWHRRIPTLQYENFNSFQGISLWSALQVQQNTPRESFICTTIRTASDSLQLRGNGVLLLPDTITTIPFQSHK
jgi:hypothetical protein